MIRNALCLLLMAKGILYLHEMSMTKQAAMFW